MTTILDLDNNKHNISFTIYREYFSRYDCIIILEAYFTVHHYTVSFWRQILVIVIFVSGIYSFTRHYIHFFIFSRHVIRCGDIFNHQSLYNYIFEYIFRLPSFSYRGFSAVIMFILLHFGDIFCHHHLHMGDMLDHPSLYPFL